MKALCFLAAHSAVHLLKFSKDLDIQEKRKSPTLLTDTAVQLQ